MPLDRIALQTTETPLAPPSIDPAEHEQRMEELHRRAGSEWVAVYGDREHSANLSFLCGYDPRFEEALLLLGPNGRRLLLVGNEGLGYAPWTSPGVEPVLAQSLSLLAQWRDEAPRLDGVLREIGVAGPVAVVGWKYLGAEETDAPTEPAFVPALVVSALRAATGEAPFDATPLVMDAATGLRSIVSAHQIAVFEWGAARASDAVMRIVAGTRPGMSELEAAADHLGYAGEVLTCHVMLSADDRAVVGLRSPGARVIQEGDAVTTAVGYAGGLCSRAGAILAEPDEAFLTSHVEPYFATLRAWYEAMRAGVTGGEVFATVVDAIGDAPFRSLLNPGHLGSYDEWVHSPIRPGSEDPIASGMVFQCDIIPTSTPPGRALNCEDTIAIADEALRAELARDHPDIWSRIDRRRGFVRNRLGIELHEDVLPLGDSVGYLPPFWLAPDLVCIAA